MILKKRLLIDYAIKQFMCLEQGNVRKLESDDSICREHLSANEVLQIKCNECQGRVSSQIKSI